MLPYTELSMTIHFADQAFTQFILQITSKFHACFLTPSTLQMNTICVV